jgi:hypothetical protein
MKLYEILGIGGNALGFGGGGGTSLPALTDNGTNVISTEAILAPDGTASLPGFAFSGATNMGMFRSANILGLGEQGGAKLALVNNNAQLRSDGDIAWVSTTDPVAGSLDTNISRQAAGVIQIGTNALNSSGSLQLLKITKYNAISTTGIGTVPVYGATSQKAETTTADANVLTYTPPATAGTYRVNVNISVSSATAGVIAWTLSWTDSNGNAQANIAMPLFQHGTAAPNTTFTTSVAGNYTGTSTIDINNAAASIIVKWVGGGTSAAKISAVIEQLQ